MTSVPDFLAAARLAAFANLTITEENWRSLWLPGGYTHYVTPLWTLPAYRKVRRNTFVMRQLRARMDRPSGELWRAFVDDAVRIATGRHRPPFGAVVRDARLTEPWASQGAAGTLTIEDVRLARTLVRHQLTQISVDRALGSVLGSLHNVPLRLIAQPDAADEFHRDQLRLRLAPVARTLRAQLSALLIETALAGVWPRFFTCAGPGCHRFGVARVIGRERNFCSTLCRVRASRQLAASGSKRRGGQRR